MNQYAHKPKLRQEITERFTKKISQIKKESSEIEHQIKELEGAI
jgi:Mg2+ and Co2+ transporter CorA